MFEFISHQFLNDQYTKEIAYIMLDKKYRVAFVRKEKKDGGLFWTEIQCSATVDSEKKYFFSIEFDSNFLRKDIIAFLDARPWEKRAAKALSPISYAQDISPSSDQMSFIEEPPF